MQRSGKRGKFRTPYSNPPAGYSRARAQRRGGRIARRRRQFRPGYDRTSGFYGRYAGSGTEFKFFDVDVDDAAIAVAGTIAASTVLTIAEGNGESNRVGRKVTVRNIGWRFQVKLTAAAAGSAASDSVRVILYLDKQTNGSAATATMILESDDYQSFNNLANKGRFRVLMDRTYDVNASSGSGRGTTDTMSFGDVVVNDTFFKKCNIPIEYDNSASDGSLGSMRSNNIGVLLLSKDGHCGFESKMRFRYSDH